MYNRILECLNDLKIKDSDFSKSIGISNSAFAQWKKRGTIPAPLMLQRISNSLNVSVHWLLFGTLENNLDLKCLSDFDLTPESIVSRIENALELKTQNFSKKYDTAFFETISDIVSIQELCNWKKRRLSLDYIKLLKIARRLAVSYEWLLTGNTLSMEQNCCNHFDDLQTRDRRLAVEIINSLYFAEQYRFMQIDNNRRK
ncbi:helix-turn-helix domain-containing protein [Treponema sp.]|uniref:helix-turn-helix domain-containing protein n=1 Tax=Treponema sp. TaxID=166 RepID=UPI00257FFB68|nr:helix-turn-helix domain-containing protein [Treponema sp.]